MRIVATHSTHTERTIWEHPVQCVLPTHLTTEMKWTHFLKDTNLQNLLKLQMIPVANNYEKHCACREKLPQEENSRLDSPTKQYQMFKKKSYQKHLKLSRKLKRREYFVRPVFFSFLLSKICFTCKPELQSRRERLRDPLLLVYSLSGQSWTDPKLGSRSFLGVSHVGVGAPVLRVSCTAFQGYYQGA